MSAFPSRPPDSPSSRTVRIGILLWLTACVAIAFTASDRDLWPVLVAVVFLQSLLVLWIWRRAHIEVREVVGVAILGRCLLFPLTPTLTDDSYRYIWDGLVQITGVNPYAFPPDSPALEALQGEWIYGVLNSQPYISVYPPVSQVVFLFGGLFYGFGWEASFYAVKAVFVLAEIGALGLLARLCDARSLLLYAWNPVVLIETAGQAHTEGMMVFGLVGCVWALRRGRSGLSVAALWLAVWVKLYPVFLLPFLLRRLGWRYLGLFAALSAVLAAPYYEPGLLARVGSSIDLYVRLFEFNAGPYYLAKWGMTEWTGREGWSKVLGPMFRQAFLVVVPLLFTLDWWRRWTFPKAGVVVFGAYFVLATTLHPWYLLAILCLVPLLSRPPWGWLWLSTGLIGTYLFYSHGVYWPFVILSWLGWLVLGLLLHRSHGRDLLAGLMEQLLRFRGASKWTVVRRLIPDDTDGLDILDLGAGEGFVALAAAADGPRRIILADVLPMNRTDLPWVGYDGERLPFDDRSFDWVMLVFVLHHAEAPDRVVREALRVARRGVVVLESTYRSEWNRRLLDRLDRLANRLRSGGRMDAQEAHLHFRRAPEWPTFFEREGARVEHIHREGRWVHEQTAYRLTSRTDSILPEHLTR